jgi:hypothetical protein
MNIINSEILTSKHDVFWDEVPQMAGNIKAIPVLVITEQLSPANTDRAQLHKMLAACGLSDGEYYILELQSDALVAWHKLHALFQPRVVMLLGISPAQLGISALFRMCEPNRFDDAIWLAAPSVTNMEQQPDVKKQLWHSGMKPVFIERLFGDVVTSAA